jgi:hypothetical protein
MKSGFICIFIHQQTLRQTLRQQVDPVRARSSSASRSVPIADRRAYIYQPNAGDVLCRLNSRPAELAFDSMRPTIHFGIDSSGVDRVNRVRRQNCLSPLKWVETKTWKGKTHAKRLQLSVDPERQVDTESASALVLFRRLSEYRVLGGPLGGRRDLA